MNQLSKEEPGDVAGVELGRGREAAPVPGKAAVTRAELDLQPLPSLPAAPSWGRRWTSARNGAEVGSGPLLQPRGQKAQADTQGNTLQR